MKNFRIFVLIISGLIILLNIFLNKDRLSSYAIALIFGVIFGLNLAKLKNGR
jgi:hypothetical protein